MALFGSMVPTSNGGADQCGAAAASLKYGVVAPVAMMLIVVSARILHRMFRVGYGEGRRMPWFNISTPRPRTSALPSNGNPAIPIADGDINNVGIP